jgi:hypothetical protein
MLGNALGQGITSGLRFPMQLRQAEKYGPRIDQLGNNQLAMLGLGGKQVDPLTMLLMQQLGMGGGQQNGVNSQSTNGGVPRMLTVRQLKDGAEGTIPENEFDPSLYEIIK